jgi:hypothetical protein
VARGFQNVVVVVEGVFQLTPQKRFFGDKGNAGLRGGNHHFIPERWVLALISSQIIMKFHHNHIMQEFQNHAIPAAEWTM